MILFALSASPVVKPGDLLNEEMEFQPLARRKRAWIQGAECLSWNINRHFGNRPYAGRQEKD